MMKSVMQFDLYIIIYRELEMLKAAQEENGFKDEREEACSSSETIQLDEDEDEGHFTHSTVKVSKLGLCVYLEVSQDLNMVVHHHCWSCGPFEPPSP